MCMKILSKILFGGLMLGAVNYLGAAAPVASGVTVVNRSSTTVGVVGMVQDSSKPSGYVRVTESGMGLAPNSQVVLAPSITRVVIKQAPVSTTILGSANNLGPTHTVVINPDSTVTFPVDVVSANAAIAASNRLAYSAQQQGVGFAAAQDQAATRAAQDQAAALSARQQANTAILQQGGILSGSKITLNAPFGKFDLVIKRVQSAANAADDGIRIGDIVSLSDAQGVWSSKNPEALVKNAVSSGQNDEYFTVRLYGEVPMPARLLMHGDTNVNFVSAPGAYLSHQPSGVMQINRYFIMNRSNYTSLIWEQFGVLRAN